MQLPEDILIEYSNPYANLMYCYRGTHFLWSLCSY